ncbi:YczE/YyaS/YitT family protein [Phascolarctobacterium succinatutens]|uniref:YczE/YyaS/YitT family protein n=1 Tax=Phascolarctobacterium succinatutens TaxID=626940 RepID=UPI0030B8FF38
MFSAALLYVSRRHLYHDTRHRSFLYSCLGTSPISSVPWVLSMFTPWSIGEITIVLNLLFIIAQPILLRQIYWRELLGQLITLIAFGYCIDFSMSLLDWVAPDTLFWQWFDCILSTIILALGVFLCIRAKIFVAAGEGIVLVISFISKIRFSIIKNCFDCTLVAISLAISFMHFGAMRGVGVGTIAAAILVGRWIQLYSNRLHIFDKWSILE